MLLKNNFYKFINYKYALFVALDLNNLTTSPVYESMTLISLSGLLMDIMNLSQGENNTVQIVLVATLNSRINNSLL